MFDIHSTTVPAFSVSIAGPDFVFADINADCLRISGMRAGDQIGRRPQDCFPLLLSDRLLAHYRCCAEANKPVTYELEYVLPSGYTCWRTTLVPFVSLATGQVVRGTDKRLGLVLIDLDGFKPINDLFGHRAGDDILRKVARRMSGLVSPDDTLARIGGDEFALLTDDGSPSALRALTKRIEDVFAKPFRIGDNAVRVGASVGVGSQIDADRALGGLFERADQALYERKHTRHRLSA